MAENKSEANCRIGSCQRHGECMYAPCRMTPASDAVGGLEELANRIDACVEDAKRSEPVFGNPSFARLPSPAIVSLANGLSAISTALRAYLQEQSK